MATKDDKFSLNISLDTLEDKEIIEYFKQGGKRVDLLRAAMQFYFDNKRGLSEIQEDEVKRLIKNALDNLAVNINTSNVVINSDILLNSTTDNDNITKVQQPKEQPNEKLNEVISNCGVDIDFQ